MLVESDPIGRTSLAGEPLRVLYVEDNPSNVLLMQRLLARRTEVLLLLARTGQAALDIARARRPDLVLLDLHLPDLPGVEVLERLLTAHPPGACQVVVLSADALTTTRADALRRGAAQYLTKPLDVARLYALIDAAQARRRPLML